MGRRRHRGRYAKRLKPNEGSAARDTTGCGVRRAPSTCTCPERWGYVQFSSAAAGTSSDAFTEDPNDLFKWALRRLYYRQRRFRETNGKYATTLSALGADGTRCHPRRGLRLPPDDPGDAVVLRNHRQRVRQPRRAHQPGRPRVDDSIQVRRMKRLGIAAVLIAIALHTRGAGRWSGAAAAGRFAPSSDGES